MIDKLRAGIAFVALMLIVASPASASSAVCEQYPDLPQCNPTAIGGGTGSAAQDGGGAGEDGGLAASSAIPGGGGDGGASAEAGKAGDLPFTGYPLSPLVAVLLALLVAGIAVRGYLAIRRRLSVAPGERAL